MAHTRKDVWKLGAGWSDTLSWYARGVSALQQRPITDRTSWTYLASLHGFDEGLWRAFGYLGSAGPFPAPGDALPLQCQHQSWYFLPWHRGYLAAFEAIVRDAIVKLGGPADWALPYWNYSDASNPRAGELPPAFAAAKMPDGSPNPLKVAQRYGVNGAGRVVIDRADASVTSALSESEFPGDASGGSAGFGGPDTPFSHTGSDFDPPNPSGVLEDSPHNIVHGLIGGFRRGGNPNSALDNGLMSMPDTAALDPIFWLHHANIDRLWEVWLRRDAAHLNATAPAWLDGPAGRKFQMPGVDGTAFAFTAREMLDMSAPQLDYVYEDVSDPLGGRTRLADRLAMLGRPAPAPAMGMAMGATMARPPQAELLGANAQAVRLEGKSVNTQVALDPQATRKLSASFAPRGMGMAGAAAEPDRVFLNLENIRGGNDGVIFDIYVGLPPGAKPEDHPENRAGAVALFGVAKASRDDGGHGGNGLVKVVEITRVIDALHLKPPVDLQKLNIQFVPRHELLPADNISIERVSVYRQGRSS